MGKYYPKYLDKEEKELMEDIEKMDLNQVSHPTEKEQKEFKEAAKRYLKKETKMNIRIDPYELEKIKKHAEKEGLKYQTFIKSIIHKYITGQLIYTLLFYRMILLLYRNGRCRKLFAELSAFLCLFHLDCYQREPRHL